MDKQRPQRTSEEEKRYRRAAKRWGLLGFLVGWVITAVIFSSGTDVNLVSAILGGAGMGLVISLVSLLILAENWNALERFSQRSGTRPWVVRWLIGR